MQKPALPLFCPYCGKQEAKFSSKFVTPGKLTIVVYKCERCGFLFKVDEVSGEPPPPSS